MDQLKPILAQLKKHHFWVLSSVVSVLCVAFGYLGTTQLSKKWHDRESGIKSSFSSGKEVSSVSHHPNDDTAKSMHTVNLTHADKVFTAWQDRYSRQKEILVWPKELRQDFISKVADLQPIELKVPFPEPAGFRMQRNERARYLNYIHNELPKLADRIKAKWSVGVKLTDDSDESGMAADESGGPPDGGGGFDFGGGGSETDSGIDGNAPVSDEPNWVVDWSGSNQIELLTRFDWSGNSDGVPSVGQILYAQEDLWVLANLMDIIRQTNGDADAQYNAAVKSIDALHLGSAAGGIHAGGDVMEIGGASSTLSSSPYGETSSGNTKQSGQELDFSSDGSSPYGSGMDTVGNSDPADNRYVDGDYAPVQGSQLRAAFKSTSSNDAFLVIAKRMPVRMVLTVDVLKLPKLLGECGNAKLMFEVRQVRINPQSTTDATGGGGDSGEMGSSHGPSNMGAGMGGSGSAPGLGSDMGGGGMAPGMDGDEGNSSEFGGVASAQDDQSTAYEAEVELYGLIYLYNAPQRGKIGLPEVDPAAAQAGNNQNDPAVAPAGAGG